MQIEPVGTENKTHAHISEDMQHWVSSWIWKAVLCLTEVPDFNSSPKWIAQRLNVTVEKAVDALEGLERLGKLERVNGHYQVSNTWEQTGVQELDRSELLKQHSKIAPQLISRLNENDKYTAQFFVGNQDLISKYAPKFMQIFCEMNAEGRELGLKEVIASEISFVQLTNPTNDGGQQ